MTERQHPPEPRPIFQLTLRAEEPATDAIHPLRRGLKFLLRVCHLRAISIVELHPDPPDDSAGTGRP